MKRIAIATIAVALIGCAASALAQSTQFAVDTPALTLDGNHVDLNFNITGLAPVVHDVKIMYCNCLPFNELSTIQDHFLAIQFSSEGKTTTKAMIQSGWTIQSVFGIGINEFFIVFVK